MQEVVGVEIPIEEVRVKNITAYLCGFGVVFETLHVIRVQAVIRELLEFPL